MRRSLLAAACFAALVAGVTTSQAAPMSTLPSLSASQEQLVQPAANRCHWWKHECARRWGWGGWRYRRCLSLHGCL